MTKEETIKLVKEVTGMSLDWDDAHYEALQRAIGACEQTGWIPVSEKLPKDKTYVLTTIKVPNRIAHVRSGWYDGGFFHNDNGDSWKATDMEVKAWMPLPKPYKGGKEK